MILIIDAVKYDIPCCCIKGTELKVELIYHALFQLLNQNSLNKQCNMKVCDEISLKMS